MSAYRVTIKRGGVTLHVLSYPNNWAAARVVSCLAIATRVTPIELVARDYVNTKTGIKQKLVTHWLFQLSTNEEDKGA